MMQKTHLPMTFDYTNRNPNVAYSLHQTESDFYVLRPTEIRACPIVAPLARMPRWVVDAIDAFAGKNGAVIIPAINLPPPIPSQKTRERAATL